MGWEDLHNEMNSNHAEDDFVIPSDHVWDDINAELNGNKDNRAWFLFIGLFLLGSCYFIFNDSIHEDEYNSADKSKYDVRAKIQTNSNNYDLVNINASLHEEETEVNEDILTSKVNKEIKSERSVSLSDKNLTKKNNLINKRDQTIDRSSSQSNVTETNNLAGSNSDSYDTDFNFKQFVWLETHDKEITTNSILKSHSKSQDANDVESRVINQIDHQRTMIFTSHLTRKNSVLFFEKQDVGLNDKMVFLENKNKRINRALRISVLGYSSLSDYNINDFSGFGTLEFDLKSNLSTGYVFELEKYLTNRLFISTGFGVDHSHFDADYSFDISDNEILNTAQQNGQSITSVVKQIPSLAGNLTSVFEINTFQNLQSNNYSVNLGHDYKTIYIPLSIGYKILDQDRLNMTMSVQADFSKRLLSIDTGVNSIRSGDPLESIQLREFSGNATEINPFRIYNIYVGPKTEFLYSITHSLHVGMHLSYSKAINTIYSDTNFSVDRQFIRSGLKLTLSI